MEAEATQIAAPEPGIYEGVPFETYLAWDAASNSRLVEMERSPAHCRAKIDAPRKSTPAQELGTALHFAILEPELFASRYAVAPVCDRRYKEGKQVWADFVAANPGKCHLDNEDWETCQAVADAVRKHPDAGLILRATDKREVSGVWDDPATGLRCKLRMDLPCQALGILADLKSTEDASPAAFARSIVNFNYHCQGAHYLGGAAALDWIFEQFCVIAFEKSKPYGVMVYRLEDEALEIGERKLRPFIEQYAACKRSGIWPGYPTGVKDITLPDWELRKYQQ